MVDYHLPYDIVTVALTYDTHIETICEVIWLASGYRSGLHKKLDSLGHGLAILQRCFGHPYKFSHFDMIHDCD